MTWDDQFAETIGTIALWVHEFPVPCYSRCYFVINSEILYKIWYNTFEYKNNPHSIFFDGINLVVEFEERWIQALFNEFQMAIQLM